MARRFSAPNDDYKIKDTCHVRELAGCDLFEIGGKMSEGDPVAVQNLVRKCADALNVDKDERIIALFNLKPSSTSSAMTINRPIGYEVLNVWKERECSTIRVLKNTFGKVLKRQDLVKMVEDSQKNLVYLTVVLVYDGKTIFDMSGQCSGNMQLLEFIGPQVRRKFSSELLNPAKRMVIRLYRDGDLTWSSPAKLFKGKQLTLEKTFVNNHPNRGANSEKAKATGQRVKVRREAVSNMDQDIIFELATEDDVVTPTLQSSDDDDDDDDDGGGGGGGGDVVEQQSALPLEPDSTQPVQEEDQSATCTSVVSAQQHDNVFTM